MKQKIKIVYYSLQGNTKYAAERIAKISGAELLRLKPDQEPKIGGFWMKAQGGWEALTGMKPGLQSNAEQLEDCGTLVIGGPTWAGTYAPAIGSLLEILNQCTVKPERVYLFGCSGSGKTEKMFREIARKLGCEIQGTASFLNPLSNQERENPGIDSFAESLQK